MARLAILATFSSPEVFPNGYFGVGMDWWSVGTIMDYISGEEWESRGGYGHNLQLRISTFGTNVENKLVLQHVHGVNY